MWVFKDDRGIHVVCSNNDIVDRYNDVMEGQMKKFDNIDVDDNMMIKAYIEKQLKAERERENRIKKKYVKKNKRYMDIQG